MQHSLIYYIFIQGFNRFRPNSSYWKLQQTLHNIHKTLTHTHIRILYIHTHTQSNIYTFSTCIITPVNNRFVSAIETLNNCCQRCCFGQASGFAIVFSKEKGERSLCFLRTLGLGRCVRLSFSIGTIKNVKKKQTKKVHRWLQQMLGLILQLPPQL